MMDNAGFASSRGDGFPSGLRVLVVDDDLTWLKILEKMLKKCFYEVTTCCLAMEALSILRERKNGFDIVISDVNMPDMDGFKLLEHVGLEMDLPVIMMSVDGETSRVMKGVQHGACDYLLKPIRMKELRNIWQHVLRKRINDVQNYDEVIQMMRNGSEQTQSVAVHNYLNEISPTRKRKDADCKNIDSTELGDAFAKRARVVWTVELHQKFVKAVKLIGIEKIRPKNILDSMNVPWLTRENVASHLQKYRLYLSRLQRENGDKPFEISNHLDVDFCLVKHSDISTNAEEIYFGAREISSRKHMNAENGASSSNIYCTGDLEVKDTKSKSFKLQNKKIRVGESVESDMKSANIDANIMERNSWGGETKNSHENVSKFHKNRFEHADSELALVAFGKDYKFQRDESEDLYDLHHSNESDLMANVPVHLYDALRFDWWSEAPGCPMMDQSLSIADTVHFSSSYYPVS